MEIGKSLKKTIGELDAIGDQMALLVAFYIVMELIIAKLVENKFKPFWSSDVWFEIKYVKDMFNKLSYSMRVVWKKMISWKIKN